jgi:hypothetical protein
MSQFLDQLHQGRSMTGSIIKKENREFISVPMYHYGYDDTKVAPKKNKCESYSSSGVSRRGTWILYRLILR